MYFLVAGLTAVYKIGHCIKPTFCVFWFAPQYYENSIGKVSAFSKDRDHCSDGPRHHGSLSLRSLSYAQAAEIVPGALSKSNRKKNRSGSAYAAFQRTSRYATVLIEKPGTKKRAKSISTMRKATDKKIG